MLIIVESVAAKYSGTGTFFPNQSFVGYPSKPAKLPPRLGLGGFFNRFVHNFNKYVERVI